MRQLTLEIFIARSILIGCEKNKNWPEVKKKTEVRRALLLKARYVPCKQKSNIFARFPTARYKKRILRAPTVYTAPTRGATEAEK